MHKKLLLKSLTTKLSATQTENEIPPRIAVSEHCSGVVEPEEIGLNWDGNS